VTPMPTTKMAPQIMAEINTSGTTKPICRVELKYLEICENSRLPRKEIE